MKIFKEEQRFNQPWVIILILASGILPIGIVLFAYLQGEDQVSLNEVFVVSLITILVFGLFFLFKLTTRIDETGIQYRFFPFHFKFKKISWDEISKAYTRKYNAVTEYGGWGLRGGFFWKKSKGIAVNVSGNIGIQLELIDGKKILIGTNQEEQAKQTLTHYASKIKTI